jgi:hypothetical protein
MPKKLGRPSPATFIACIALFFAVAGGSAIALKGRNTVDSGDIKNKQVKTSDLANNAVTTRKIKGNAVRTSDIQNGQVRTGDIQPLESLHVVGTAGEPAFGNGGEGDCIWSATSSSPLPYRFGPPGFYKDALGYVHLTGVAFAVNGPGGDAVCGGAGPGEGIEDAIAFILPAGYRQTSDKLVATGTLGALIAGSTPLIAGSDVIPAGGVADISSSGAILLDGITLEPVGQAGGLPRRGDSAGSGASGGGLLPKDLAHLFG